MKRIILTVTLILCATAFGGKQAPCAKVICKFDSTYFNNGKAIGAPGYHFYKVPELFDGFRILTHWANETDDSFAKYKVKREGLVYAVDRFGGSHHLYIRAGWKEVVGSKWSIQFGETPTPEGVNKIYYKNHDVGKYEVFHENMLLLWE